MKTIITTALILFSAIAAAQESTITKVIKDGQVYNLNEAFSSREYFIDTSTGSETITDADITTAGKKVWNEYTTNDTITYSGAYGSTGIPHIHEALADSIYIKQSDGIKFFVEGQADSVQANGLVAYTRSPITAIVKTAGEVSFYGNVTQHTETGSAPLDPNQLLWDGAGIEGYPNSTGQPPGNWSQVSATYSLESTTVFDGTTAVNVLGSDNTTHIRTSEASYNPAGYAGGKTYTFTCKVYVVSGTPADSRVTLYDVTGGSIISNTATQTGVWEDLTVTFTPSSAGGFRLYLYAGGQTIYDRMKLVEN